MATLSNGYALVTGASQGLGRAIAYELALKGFNLILVALPDRAFDELKSECKNWPVDVRFFETDLSQQNNIYQLAKTVNENFELTVLVNNAGVGGTCPFADVSPEKILQIIQINITALSLMCRLLLPNLLQRRSYILNVSSMAAFSPMGYKTVYPASKAFVHHFTRGLYQELKNTSVFVSVVNPGPMATNPEITERIHKMGWRGRLGLMSPEQVARISVRQLFKKDTLIMLGWSNGLNWALMKCIPIWIRLPLLTKAIQRELKV
jgi:short-subunit dehydrogenase